MGRGVLSILLICIRDAYGRQRRQTQRTVETVIEIVFQTVHAVRVPAHCRHRIPEYSATQNAIEIRFLQQRLVDL